MSDIKRWTWPTDEAPGNWVLWTDHVAAVAEAEQRAEEVWKRRVKAVQENAYESGMSEARTQLAYEALGEGGVEFIAACQKADTAMGRRDGYEQGQRDERERIRKAVEGLPHDPNCRSYRGGPCGCAWRVTFLAVIDREAP